MKKMAICWIGVGDYNVLFDNFYSSFKEKFCTELDRKFIIFTDRPQITEGKDDCITYVISNACLHKGYIMFRKFKYLLMAEDIYLNFDIISYMNGNCFCKEQVELNEIFNEKLPISCISHPDYPIKYGIFNNPKTICSFNIEGEWLYKQSGLYITTSKYFLRMAHTIECWRMYDKLTGGDRFVPTHDESYANKFYYMNRDIINVLDGRKYACPSDFDEYDKCKIACMRKQKVFAEKNVKYVEPNPQDLYYLN